MDQSREKFRLNSKNRRTETGFKFLKVDSPLGKYDSSGNLSCILCRIPIKVNVWKVHLNSKVHKQFVEHAKKQQMATEKNLESAITVNSKTISDKAQIGSFAKHDAEQLKISSHTEKTATELPEKFFDNEKSVNTIKIDHNTDAEWAKFQREIRAADTISNILVAEEQDDLNIKRHLKEMDEQIENWKRFIKINDKKNVLLSKKRKEIIPLELESSSSEECGIEDLLDWRIKSVKK